MPTKVLQEEKTVLDVARELNRYSPDAFDFLREALDYTVRHRHAKILKVGKKIRLWLEKHAANPADFLDVVATKKLPKAILKVIDHFGGLEEFAKQLNLHVSGAELCEGFRALARERWGFMASAVLRNWGIRGTVDIGSMVFALVNNGLLQKQPHDSIEDFRDVFDFEQAFDRSYRIDLSQLGKMPAGEPV